MPNPETVKTSQAFRLDKIIYNYNGFSIGVGTLIGNDSLVLAMRWNGEDDKAGFPYAGKHPLWLFLPSELTFSVLTGLLNAKSITSEDYTRLLEYLHEFKILKPTREQITIKNELFDEIFPSKKQD
jgi:hypothetical protein